MVKKSFRVTVCFDLHQVSCPGVWLCPKGKIFITVSLFKCLETTRQVKPVFPLKFHQRFVFDKIFDSVSSLGELETDMSTRNIRMELVQVFKGKLKMITLGVFQAALTSVLYPAVASGSDCGAAEVDLLFEPCHPFPGIISPKAEVSTRAVIEELRLCPKFTDGPVNPTLVPSAMKCGRSKCRQKAVCHNKPSQCTCSCCSSINTIKKRPKTTSGRISPPAKSSKCKGLPPPRPKTTQNIEGGSESAADSDAGLGRKAIDSSPSQGSSERQNQSLRNQGELNEIIIPSSSPPQGKDHRRNREDVQGNNTDQDEESRLLNSQNGRFSRPGNLDVSRQVELRRQTVEVDVHAQQSDYEEQPLMYNKAGRNEFQNEMNGRSSIQTDRRNKSASDRRSYTYQNQQDDTIVTPQSRTKDVIRPGCDCFTCGSCRQTMENFMVPWKVFAAPPSLEHCFCHSKMNAQVEGPTELSQEQGRKTVNQSVTTQTSGICRCIETKALGGTTQATSEDLIDAANKQHKDNQFC